MMRQRSTLPWIALVFAALLAFGCSHGPQPTPYEPPTQNSHESERSDPDPACAGNSNIVEIQDGKICGTQGKGAFPGEESRNVWSYRGIPYAASTGGTNRFLSAQPPNAWGDNTLDATKFGPWCSQLATVPKTGVKSLKGSDDCLSVNVFTPVAPGSTPDERLPVMVFIHGGAFIAGASGLPVFDGSNLAGGGDVVVVTLNYRLGVLGFLGGIDAGDVNHGNLGLKDQQQAMRWVQANIQAFGGDESNITLFGESAGASSVGVHLVNAESQKLFARGIMESNHYGMTFQTPQSARHRAHALLKHYHCKGSPAEQLNCLREAADEDLLGFLKAAGPAPAQALEALICNGFGGFEYWAPVIDGDFVKAQPYDTVITKPVMMGTNTNEGVLFTAIAGMYPPVKTAVANLALDAVFGLPRGLKIEHAYPGLKHAEEKGVPLARIFTDSIWNCANNQVLNAAVGAGNESVYAYQFTHVPTVSLYPMGTNDKDKPFIGNFCGPDPSVNPHPDNVCHGNELAYVFGNHWGYTTANQAQPEGSAFAPDEVSMTAQVMKLWTDFATKGDPGNGFPAFHSESLPGGVYWNLRDPKEGGFAPTTSLYEESKCDLWQNKVKYKKTWVQKLCTGG